MYPELLDALDIRPLTAAPRPGTVSPGIRSITLFSRHPEFP